MTKPINLPKKINKKPFLTIGRYIVLCAVLIFGFFIVIYIFRQQIFGTDFDEVEGFTAEKFQEKMAKERPYESQVPKESPLPDKPAP